MENDKKDCDLIEKIIKNNFPAFKFIGTDNGFEAINIVLKHHPSLIITSHNLPLMNGIQFVKSILRGDKRFYAPIIAMIENPDESALKAYRDVGVKSLITKPIDSKIINREINSVLN